MRIVLRQRLRRIAAGEHRAGQRVRPDLRARNRVERILLGALILASSIAVLTTGGIVWSMFAESLAFFRQYPAADFFLGLTWSPNFKGGSELGFLPLLWGTLYISVIAMIVSVAAFETPLMCKRQAETVQRV